MAVNSKTAEKEVRDTSCGGLGVSPSLKKVPQEWGIRGLIQTISAIAKYEALPTDSEFLENANYQVSPIYIKKIGL